MLDTVTHAISPLSLSLSLSLSPQKESMALETLKLNPHRTPPDSRHCHTMTQPHFHVLLLLLLSAILTAESHTAPGDAAAMHALSKSIGADKALNWSPTSDPCSAWPKIGCTDGMVTRIQIGNIKDLSGTLPPEIGNLTSLTRLEVQYVGLTGPLPSLRGLSNLQVLYLHDNFFSFIPPDFFAGLSALTDVNLDNNPFEPWQIPESLKGCASLANFSANNASVTGGVPDFFGTSFPVLFHLALSNNQLQGEIPPSFAHSGMSSLWLNNQKGGTKLSGSIDVISNMTNLLELWLQSNSFSGPLPDFSQLTNLQNMSLRDNHLTGIVPKSLTSLKSLKNVILTNNLLQGPVPVFSNEVNLDLDPQSESFCHNSTEDCNPRVNILLSVASSFGYPTKFAENWLGNDPCVGWLGISCDGSGNITVVNFQKMNLSGVISPDFQLLGSLQKLILSGNNLTGTIPPGLVNLKLLKELDVSNNFLWGKVPSFNSNVIVNTDGNPNIGKDSGGPPGGTAPGSPNSGSGSGESSSGKKSSLGVIVGTVAAGVIVIGIIALLGFCYWKRKKQNFGPISSSTVIHPRHSGSDPEMVKITVGLNGGIGSGSETTSHSGSGPSNLHVVEPVNMVISIQVLRNVTNNFSEDNILGRGGFGTVYKGELHDGTMIAVKRMESGAMGSKGLNEFKSEISVLTKVRHRHLVSLLGYCLEGNERILVYEYMPQGTLSHHLFNWARAGLKPLEWKKRLSIGLDVARGVEYLHSLANQSFIHRDLKPSNILLGDDMKAKVADFGLVRLAPEGKHCSVETRLAGTFGYLAPEYAVTGRVTTKADVFSFGVILMELITGRKALDDSRPEESMHLVTWFRRMQLNKETSLQAIDPTLDLDDKETFASIRTVTELAGHCCLRDPYQRPDIGYAVNTLSSLAEQWKPSEPNMEDGLGIDLDMTLPQALMRWQAFGDGSSEMYSGFSSSQISSRESTQTSIPTRPTGFAEPLNLADGR